MTQAEIITIGTELLLGEIQDTNTRYLTRQLRQLGVDVFRVTTIGDNPLRIADVIRESLTRADIIITTGGLGPTIDDPTRNAVALAYNIELVFYPDLWETIKYRFQSRGLTPTDNNRKQAFLPANAYPVTNPVGTAPAFYTFEDDHMVLCLPGVPAEMERIFQDSVIPLLQEKFYLHQTIKTRVLHSIGLGESQLDEKIADLETYSNPTVGLSAHPGSVDIRITAKSGSIDEADRMISEIEKVIRTRLADFIYGADEESMVDRLAQIAEQKSEIIHLFLYGFISLQLLIAGKQENKWIIYSPLEKPFSIVDPILNPSSERIFIANYYADRDPCSLEMFSLQGAEHTKVEKIYKGPPSQCETWLMNACLAFIWQQMKLP